MHCTATAQTATVHSILRYWREKLGWKMPGYHYIISADGTITQLAEDERICNGATGWNSTSLHVAYIGGIIKTANGIRSRDTRTAAQKLALERLLSALHGRYPKAFIEGHRDLPNVGKECPCFDAIPEYEHIRNS